MAISDRYLRSLLLKPLFGSFLAKRGLIFKNPYCASILALLICFFYEFGGSGSWIGEKQIYP